MGTIEGAVATMTETTEAEDAMAAMIEGMTAVMTAMTEGMTAMTEGMTAVPTAVHQIGMRMVVAEMVAAEMVAEIEMLALMMVPEMVETNNLTSPKRKRRQRRRSEVNPRSLPSGAAKGR